MPETQTPKRLSDEITVTPAAVEQLIALTQNEAGIIGVRVFVSGGGCGGMSYGMTFVEEPQSDDCVLACAGMDVYIDSTSLGFLQGVEIDFLEQGEDKSFVFKNAPASGGCGSCGSSSGGGCA